MAIKKFLVLFSLENKTIGRMPRFLSIFRGVIIY